MHTWPTFKFFGSVLLSLSLLVALPVTHANELLEVDEAFQLQTPTVENGKIVVQWNIAEDYKLYKDKMSITSKDITLQSLEYSAAKMVDDPLFGKTEVFSGTAVIKTPYLASGANRANLTVKYQGCADKIGVCYPPQTRELSVSLPVSNASSSTSGLLDNPFNALSGLNNLLVDSNGEPDLLPAEQAFTFSTEIINGQITANWQVADDYHLYQDKIKVTVLQGQVALGDLQLPEAKLIDDPLFGKTLVYHGKVQALLPVIDLNGSATIEFEFQGCSASAGVCYAPMRETLKVNATELVFDKGLSPAGASLSTASVNTQALSETDRITDTLKNSSVWIVIATFFVFGLLLSLTPCVFPMIPILSSIIAGQGDSITTRRAFIMSLVYVLAMSVTYTVAGVLAGVFGENLQVAFQNPWVIGTFSAIFIALAFSMFGFYELQLPNKLQTKLTNLSNKQEGGTLAGVAIMGFLSALIVGPCVAPPLAGALIYIGQTGDALLGGTALFAMSIGMGVPLLLLGTSAGKFLPKAGAWMDNVKAVFGVMLIGIAIWMAERILPVEVTLASWALLFIMSAVYLGAFDSTAEKSGWFKLFRGLGLALGLYGVMILIGLLGGSKQLLQPLKIYQGGGTQQAQSEKLDFKIIKSIADLDAELAKGQPIMLDFYADWCVSCKEMEAFTFSDVKVHKALEGISLLKADVTQNDALDKALMKKYGIVGPPAILFFNAQQQEQRAQRVVGFKNATDFTDIINQAFP